MELKEIDKIKEYLKKIQIRKQEIKFSLYIEHAQSYIHTENLKDSTKNTCGNQ